MGRGDDLGLRSVESKSRDVSRNDGDGLDFGDFLDWREEEKKELLSAFLVQHPTQAYERSNSRGTSSSSSSS